MAAKAHDLGTGNLNPEDFGVGCTVLGEGGNQYEYHTPPDPNKGNKDGIVFRYKYDPNAPDGKGEPLGTMPAFPDGWDTIQKNKINRGLFNDKSKGDESVSKTYDWDILWHEVKTMLNNGKSPQEVAIEMEIDLKALQSKIYREDQKQKQNEMKRQANQKINWHTMWPKVQELYAQGKTKTEISKELGIKYDTLNMKMIHEASKIEKEAAKITAKTAGPEILDPVPEKPSSKGMTINQDFEDAIKQMEAENKARKVSTVSEFHIENLTNRMDELEQTTGQRIGEMGAALSNFDYYLNAQFALILGKIDAFQKDQESIIHRIDNLSSRIDEIEGLNLQQHDPQFINSLSARLNEIERLVTWDGDHGLADPGLLHQVQYINRYISELRGDIKRLFSMAEQKPAVSFETRLMDLTEKMFNFMERMLVAAS